MSDTGKIKGELTEYIIEVRLPQRSIVLRGTWEFPKQKYV